MADPFIISQLQRLPLFARLSEPQLELIASVTQAAQYSAGQYVFAQGEPTIGAQVFASGRGALLSTNAQGQAATVGTVESGQIINEGALFDDGVETASLRILEPSVVLLIPQGPVRGFMAQDPALSANLRVLDPSGSRDSNKALFRGQRSNETVYRLYHRHWWGFLRHAWIPFGLAVIFLVISVIVDTRLPGVGTVLACLTLIVPLASIGFLLWEWRNDKLVLTDQRLISINMQAWRLTRSVNGIPLDRIGEVQVDIPGGDIFANMFGYGTLVVKTTADRGGITAKFMPDPASVQKTVFEQRDRFRILDAPDDQNVVRAQVAEVLGLQQPGMTAEPSGRDEAEEVNATSTVTGLPGFRTRFVTPAGAVCYRHHWVKWWRMQVFPLILLAVVLSCAGVNLTGLITLPAGVGLSIAFFVFLCGGVWVYLRDWDWRNDLMIIEADSITFQTKRPLWLQNQMEQISLTKLDNVTSSVGGIVGNMFNVGDISMSLMGSNSDKAFNTVGDPEAIQAEITWHTQRIKERALERAEDDRRQDIADYLKVYHEMTTGQPAGPAVNPAQQPTVFGAPALPTQPLPSTAPTVPSAPYPTRPNVPPATVQNPAYSAPAGLPANLTFQAPGASPAAPSVPPANPTIPTGGSRPPRVPRPRPSDLPD